MRNIRRGNSLRTGRPARMLAAPIPWTAPEETP